jgi:aminoglycoside N3'-acetyltransferase
MAEVAESELRRAVHELGLDGDVVMVHTSLRSFGERVTGGADGVLDALLVLHQACRVGKSGLG